MKATENEIYIRGDTPKDRKYHELYLDIAERVAEMSYAERLKVGTVIVKDGRILSMGWNGMPSGFDNCCEDKHATLLTHYRHSTPIHIDNPSPEDIDEWAQYAGTHVEYELKSKPEVLHSEANALAKLIRCTESAENATLYCTHPPCLPCAKLIHQAGISKVIYRYDYIYTDGLEFLNKSQVVREVIKYEQTRSGRRICS